MTLKLDGGAGPTGAEWRRARGQDGGRRKSKMAAAVHRMWPDGKPEVALELDQETGRPGQSGVGQGADSVAYLTAPRGIRADGAGQGAASGH